MAAATHDITIEQGATFLLNIVWKDSLGVPVNLTGYTASMQVRQRYASTTSVLSLSTTDSSIVLGGSAGTIDITGSATATAAIDIKQGVYDLEMTASDGTVTRLIEGCVTVSPEVTRA